eukprot:6195516-Pleurochrysis_carterae.AAC.1
MACGYYTCAALRVAHCFQSLASEVFQARASTSCGYCNCLTIDTWRGEPIGVRVSARDTCSAIS